MPQIKAFRAVALLRKLAEKVASVPYDVVNRDEAKELAQAYEHSFLHVIRPDIDLPADTNPYDDAVYSKAAANFNGLLEAGALERDSEERLFLYRQIMDGHAQVGLVCCSHVEDYEQNRILKHEKTRQAKEDDRTRHVTTLNAHTGPVFLTYRGEASIDAMVQDLTSQSPEVDFVAADGVQHTVWKVDDTDALVAALSAIPAFYVADGHHRAASAWRAAQHHRAQNANHTGDEEYNWFLTVLFPADQLRILAYNRVVKDLHGRSPSELLDALKSLHDVVPTDNPEPAQAGAWCLYLTGNGTPSPFPAKKSTTQTPLVR